MLKEKKQDLQTKRTRPYCQIWFIFQLRNHNGSPCRTLFSPKSLRDTEGGGLSNPFYPSVVQIAEPRSELFFLINPHYPILWFVPNWEWTDDKERFKETITLSFPFLCSCLLEISKKLKRQIFLSLTSCIWACRPPFPSPIRSKWSAMLGTEKGSSKLVCKSLCGQHLFNIYLSTFLQGYKSIAIWHSSNIQTHSSHHPIWKVHKLQVIWNP